MSGSRAFFTVYPYWSFSNKIAVMLSTSSTMMAANAAETDHQGYERRQGSMHIPWPAITAMVPAARSFTSSSPSRSILIMVGVKWEKISLSGPVAWTGSIISFKVCRKGMLPVTYLIWQCNQAPSVPPIECRYRGQSTTCQFLQSARKWGHDIWLSNYENVWLSKWSKNTMGGQ